MSLDRENSSGRLHYRPDIDGLRAIAVLSVMFFHAGIGVSGGFVGVDIFFVISGYLITGLILRDTRQGRFSLAEFCERRIRRILPALLLVTFTTVAAGWFLLLPDAFLSLGRSIVSMAILASNVQFWRESGYFDGAAEVKPLLHTWSLAVEEQFYLFVPLMLLGLGRIKNGRWSFAIVAACALISLAVSIYGTYAMPVATFYLVPTRAWELFAGSLLAFVPGAGPTSRQGREIATILGLGLVLTPCFIYGRATSFPGLGALPPVLGAALLIWSGSRESLARRVLVWRPLTFIGLISYSLYLWHWPLFAFTRYLIEFPSLTTRFLLVTVSIVIAIPSWRYVELPFRRRRMLASRPSIFAFGATGVTVTLASGLVLVMGQGLPRRLSPEAKVIAVTGSLDKRFVVECEARDVPARLRHFGAHGVRPKILVWGDSHAMAILPAIEAACIEGGAAAEAATKSVTPPVAGYALPPPLRPGERSRQFNAAVLEHAVSGSVDSVVLAAAWDRYLVDAEFQPALLKTVDALVQHGVKVYFMKDVPWFGFNVPRRLFYYSLMRWNPSELALSVENYRAASHLQSALLPLLRDRRVLILDPLSYLQERAGVPSVRPFDAGGSFYRDHDHLSTYGAMIIKPLFAPVVESVSSTNSARGEATRLPLAQE